MPKRFVRLSLTALGLIVALSATVGLIDSARDELAVQPTAQGGDSAAALASSSSAGVLASNLADPWVIDGCPGEKDSAGPVAISSASVTSTDDWATGSLGLEVAQSVSQGVGVTVAVVDSGVTALPDLVGVLATAISVVPGEGPEDLTGHGTQVAQLVHWVAPKATILSIKVHGRSGGSRSQVAAGITAALQGGASVINLSLVGGDEDQSVVDALRAAAQASVPVVIASGNEGLDLGRFPRFPAASAAGGALPGAIVVTGATQDGGISRQSNWGAATVAVAAPGDGLATTNAAGRSIPASGPSIAAGLTAGVLALVRQRHATVPVTQVVQRIIDTAQPTAGLSDLTIAGGTIDAAAALGC